MENMVRLFILWAVVGVLCGCGPEPPTAASLLEFAPAHVETAMLHDRRIEDFEREGIMYSWRATRFGRTMDMALVLEGAQIVPYYMENYPYKGILVAKITRNGRPASARANFKWRVRYGEYLWSEGSEAWLPIGWVVRRHH